MCVETRSVPPCRVTGVTFPLLVYVVFPAADAHHSGPIRPATATCLDLICEELFAATRFIALKVTRFSNDRKLVLCGTHDILLVFKLMRQICMLECQMSAILYKGRSHWSHVQYGVVHVNRRSSHQRDPPASSYPDSFSTNRWGLKQPHRVPLADHKHPPQTAKFLHCTIGHKIACCVSSTKFRYTVIQEDEIISVYDSAQTGHVPVQDPDKGGISGIIRRK